MTDNSMSSPSRLLLLTSLLARDGIITNNGKSFLKEMVLRRDPRLGDLMETFSTPTTKDNDMEFLEKVNDLIAEESASLFNELMADTSLEVGKKLSKDESPPKLGSPTTLGTPTGSSPMTSPPARV